MNRSDRLAKNDSADVFDEVRVAAPSGLIALLGSVRDFNQEEFKSVRHELRNLIDRYVDNGTGILVITGLSPEIEPAKRAILAVSRMLGQVLPQNSEGSLVKEVRDRGTAIGEGSRARYSDSRFGGSLHTDGAESPLPVPDIFTLFCVRQSLRGGALEFVHVRDLEKALASVPGTADVLRSGFYFDRRGDQGPGEPPATQKPILFTQRGRLSITYLRSYVERGHAHPEVPPLTDQQRSALNALDVVIASGKFTRSGKLREGELAIFDNLSLLHGRTEFHDDPEHSRLLLRTWVNRSPGDAE